MGAVLRIDTLRHSEKGHFIHTVGVLGSFLPLGHMTVDGDKTGEITRTSEPSRGALRGHLVWIKGCTERYLTDQRRKMEHKSAPLSLTIYSVVHISHNIKISIDKNVYKADLRYNAMF